MKFLIFFSILIFFDTTINGMFLKNNSLEILLLSAYCLTPIDLKIYEKMYKILIKNR